MTGTTSRPSPWRSGFAWRTYASGLLWAAGVAASWWVGVEDRAGWLAFRLDPAGVLYAAAALVGGSNFFGAGLRAARRLRRPRCGIS